MQLLIVLLIIGVTCGLAVANEDFRIIDSIHPEVPCSSAGGICTMAEDCPEGRLTEERGLCPNQRSRGVECCTDVSIKETRCRKRGGECMERCNDAFKFNLATDCPESTVCCILLH